MPITGSGIASYMSYADGLVSASGNWALISPLGFFDDFTYTATTTAVTTTYVNTPTFTGDGTVVDGVAIHFSTPLDPATVNSTITFSVALDQAGSTVAGSEVTAYVKDLGSPGWVFFKFASDITLLAATAYSIKVKCSSNGIVALLRGTGTTTNYCKFLRTTTRTSVPQNTSGQHDNIYILGEITGLGTHSDRVMTWNHTTSDTGFNTFYIGNYATLDLENDPSTDYIFQIANQFRIGQRGTINFGTIGSPIDVTSSCTVRFANGTSARVNYGGVFNFISGESKKSWTHLIANISAGATSATVSDATGWLTGDVICLAPTSRPGTYESETVTLSGVSGNNLTFGASTYAHGGVSPYIAEVGNLTRKCKFYFDTASNNFEFYIASMSSFKNIEFYNTSLQPNGNSGFGNAGLTITWDNCSIHDTNSGIFKNALYGTPAINFTNNVMYNMSTRFYDVETNGNAGVNYIDGNLFCNCTNTTTNNIVIRSNTNYTFTNNVVAGFRFTGLRIMDGSNGIVNNNTFHSWGNSATAVIIYGTSNYDNTFIIDGLITYSGYISVNFTRSGCIFFTLKDHTSYNVSNRHLVISTSTAIQPIIFNNLQYDNSVSTYQIDMAPSSGRYNVAADFYNCNFNTDGLGTTWVLTPPFAMDAAVNFYNCTLLESRFLSSTFNYGYIAAASPSLVLVYFMNFYIKKLNDTTMQYKKYSSNLVTNLQGPGNYQVLVKNGEAPNVSIKVRCSKTTSGDSETFGGDYPKLILLANPFTGVATDTVLATATSASEGNWETLSATLPPATGDGIQKLDIRFDYNTSSSAGWIEVKEFDTTQSGKDPKELVYNGSKLLPVVRLGAGTDGGGPTQIPIIIERKKLL